MTLSPLLRKVGLTAHVATSVGWLGSVVVFLALAVGGLTQGDAFGARAAYVAMERTTSLVIVPAAIASFVTGLVQAWGTPWGIVRHYWVVAKLLLSVVSTALLLLHTGPIASVAQAALDPQWTGAELRDVRIQLSVQAALAILALLAATVLSVFKPRGVVFTPSSA